MHTEAPPNTLQPDETILLYTETPYTSEPGGFFDGKSEEDMRIFNGLMNDIEEERPEPEHMAATESWFNAQYAEKEALHTEEAAPQGENRHETLPQTNHALFETEAYVVQTEEEFDRLEAEIGEADPEAKHAMVEARQNFRTEVQGFFAHLNSDAEVLQPQAKPEKHEEKVEEVIDDESEVAIDQAEVVPDHTELMSQEKVEHTFPEDSAKADKSQEAFSLHQELEQTGYPKAVVVESVSSTDISPTEQVEVHRSEYIRLRRLSNLNNETYRQSHANGSESLFTYEGNDEFKAEALEKQQVNLRIVELLAEAHERSEDALHDFEGLMREEFGREHVSIERRQADGKLLENWERGVVTRTKLEKGMINVSFEKNPDEYSYELENYMERKEVL